MRVRDVLQAIHEHRSARHGLTPTRIRLNPWDFEDVLIDRPDPEHAFALQHSTPGAWTLGGIPLTEDRTTPEGTIHLDPKDIP